MEDAGHCLLRCPFQIGLFVKVQPNFVPHGLDGPELFHAPFGGRVIEIACKQHEISTAHTQLPLHPG